MPYQFSLFSVGFKRDAIKQTYERSVKAAQDYGIMKESPEFVFLCFEKTNGALTWFQSRS